MEDSAVCYTKDAALKMAVELEHSSFETYLKAYKLSHDLRVKTILKELALEELEHKHMLEKAFFEEAVALHDVGNEAIPSMRLTSFLTAKPLNENSTPQDVMIYALHEEKRSVDFYAQMANQCTGAPMAPLFKRLHQDESGHLARLEELYEKIYMAEM
jgi:rubrerythrin